MLAVLLFLGTFLGLTAEAHRLSYSEAWATFRRDGTFTVDLFVNADELPRDPTAYYRDAVALRFDEVDVEPAISVADPGGGRSLAVVRMEGRIPAGVEVFRWHAAEDVGTVVLNLRQDGAQGALLERVDPGGTSGPYPLTVAPPPPSTVDVALTYVWLGLTHIVPKGVDHILFVLGLFLATSAARPLLLQVTAFTLAHTLTLALSTLGVVSLPASIVEPAIALSIAWIAIENLATTGERPWRPALVFGFGLLHGLGFAGVLGELGLAPDRFATSLVGFNVGVELGQLLVIGGASALLWRARHDPRYRRWVVVPASVAIGAVGLWWTVTRLGS